jgi:hypothetical protein
MVNLRIGLVLLAGAGLGFGADRIGDTQMFSNDGDGYYEYMDEDSYYGHMGGDSYYGHMRGEYRHNDGDFLEHMLEDLTVEEQGLVQEKVDQLLIDYAITLEELYDNYDVRYEFMNDLMEFLDLNGIDYHNHGGFDHYNDDENGWHGGMGMH